MTLAESMADKADAFAKTARERGYEMDYSLASLESLDPMLDELFGARGWIARRRGRLNLKEFGAMVEVIGAYVGETLRRSCGGEWGVHDEFGDGLRLPHDVWTFPEAKVEKRFANGHEDSLAFYGEVMSAMARGEA